MRLIDADTLLAEYDRQHVGPPGAARKLIEEAPTVDGWISVKDQIPDDECLCFSSEYHEMIIGYLYEDKVSASKYSAENNEMVLYNVTHWMPLPEPPKEGEPK